MDMQTYLNNAVGAMRQETLKTSPQLTLGEIILKLEAMPDHTATVQYDFEYLYPTTLDSYRGTYAELALGFSQEGEMPTIAQLLEELKGAVGKTFQGYKGGDYLMGKNTPVWVANYGNSGSTGILEIVGGKYGATIITGICDL